MTLGVCLDHIAIVLQRPRYPENIGSAARAMRNMGMRRLVVVAPEDDDLQRIYRLATHAARDVVDAMVRCDNLKAALGDFQYVVGTTARLGGERKRIATPGSMAAEVADLSQSNQVALLFGPEDRGLSNEDLRLCHSLVNIPTADFASLNLAQAVMVLCYELFQTRLPAPKPGTPRLATRRELDGMYDQVKEMLVRINYIQPENPDYWMNKLRHWFSRMHLRGGEVSIIRGICRQMDWYAEKRYRDGLAAGQDNGKSE
ncbi:MAG: RNA methyltransferase [Desulfosarcinaceae bacterium]|nr:RNA methyltransferase [Desulfosarcinaceae bacterium]